MILYEFEGKELLKKAGIRVPQSQLVASEDEIARLDPIESERASLARNDGGGVVLKAQVLSGKRADAGGIIMLDSIDDLGFKINELIGKTINGEKVEKVLVEEKVDIDKEYYLSLSYDTETRGPLLTISEEGGSGIEDRKVSTYSINPLNPVQNLPEVLDSGLLEKLISLFFDQDCLLLEINPLVKTNSGEWVALDAKVKLDDDARVRHEDWDFPPRGIPGRLPTQREIEAKRIDEGDYRGVAGSTFFDLDGDIAIMASGGGISLTGMDALLKHGARPANFTEYSGNPPKEKVTKLTKIVLDERSSSTNKPDIHGLWVIGTVAANFTDIYETLSGLIDGLREAQKELKSEFKFPIVIRRGGPREKEAFEMLRQIKDFNLILQGEETSVAESAKIMAEKAKEYSSSRLADTRSNNNLSFDQSGEVH